MKKELLSVYTNSHHKISSEINLYAITRAKIKYLVHIGLVLRITISDCKKQSLPK